MDLGHAPDCQHEFSIEDDTVDLASSELLDDALDGSEAEDEAPKNKQYRRMVDVEFCDKLLVSVMLNVKAFGRVDMPFVLWLLVWEWHSQLKNEAKHPRKRGFELFSAKQTNCCFKSIQEWAEFDTANRGRGKGTVQADDEAPTMLSQHQAWSSLKFDKWLDIVRDMQNVIHPAFVRTMLHQHSSSILTRLRSPSCSSAKGCRPVVAQTPLSINSSKHCLTLGV
jgi:hypothetical protein